MPVVDVANVEIGYLMSCRSHVIWSDRPTESEIAYSAKYFRMCKFLKTDGGIRILNYLTTSQLIDDLE